MIAYPPPDWKDTDKFQPFFNIHLALPTNTFLRILQANPEARLVPLWIDTTITGKKAWSMAMTPVGMNLSGELKKRTMRMWNQYPKDPATSGDRTRIRAVSRNKTASVPNTNAGAFQFIQP